LDPFRTVLTISLAGVVAGCGSASRFAEVPRSIGSAQTCSGLPSSLQSAGARVLTVAVRPATSASGSTPALPEHCEVTGAIDERTGADGQPYAIKFHLRVPIGEAWNGRMVFSGGGGSNGDLGDALTVNATPSTPLAKGWAILTQDAGHDNAINLNPEKAGNRSFGFEFRARQDNFYRSLGRSTTVAKDVITAFSGKGPARTYFSGCSKGGQEAGAISWRYPDMFDGIVMGDPLMPAPVASLARPAWIAQVFGGLAKDQGLTDRNGLPFINKAFTDEQLAVLKQGVAQQCDALDGVVDGISQDLRACTARFNLASLQCSAGKTSGCLPSAHVASIKKLMTSYPGDTVTWPWDMGLVEGQYRSWWLGPYGAVQSSNNWIGRGVSTLYMTPPVAVHSTLNNGSEPYKFLLDFNFAMDLPKMFATTPGFTESSYDVSLVSTDLNGFKNRGGKMLVYHGAADGAFSINQTIEWVNKVNATNGGDASDFMRFYAVPGMGHCGGGPSTSSFDMLTAVQDWVENGKTPASILATAPAGTPWPGRTRPLCTWPKVARYVSGDVEKASSFVCQ